MMVLVMDTNKMLYDIPKQDRNDGNDGTVSVYNRIITPRKINSFKYEKLKVEKKRVNKRRLTTSTLKFVGILQKEQALQ